MAPLIDQARAHRAESVRLRTEALSLCVATRHSVRTAHERMAVGRAERARLRDVLDAPQPSPWSHLHWKRHDRELERVLVAR